MLALSLQKLNNKDPIFISGASGNLARNWINLYKNQFEFFGITRKKNLDSSNILNFNMSDQNLEKYFKKIKPKLFINTLAITNIELCEKDYENCKKINFEKIKTYIYLCKKYKVFFVNISTDHFSSKNKSFIGESDDVEALNNYAYFKLKLENFIKKNTSDYLIIRTNFFSDNSNNNQLIKKILNIALNKKKFKAFNNIYFTPIYSRILIPIIMQLINERHTGTFNISSNEKISKFQFANLVCNVFKINNNKIIKDKFNTIKYDLVQRPKNMALDNSKLIKLTNCKIPSLVSQLKFFYIVENYKPLKNYVPYGKHHTDIKDVNSVSNIILNKNLTQGDQIIELENNVKHYVNSKFCIAVSNCSDGLDLVIKSLNLNSKDCILTSPITFVSTAAAAFHNNLNLILTDINLNTACLDPNKIIEKLKLNKNIKVVIYVHFGGYASQIKKLFEYCNKNKIFLLEDSAHALGARYITGEKVGSCKYSHASVFSLHPVKTIAAGEGGLINTNDEKLYRKLLRLRSHGINKNDDKFFNNKDSQETYIAKPWYYEMLTLGRHCRITDIQCSLAISQLKKIEKFLIKRKKIAEYYDNHLSNIKKLKILQYKKRDKSSNHLYIVMIDFRKANIDRTTFMQILSSRNIGSQVHYIPLPIHPYIQKKGLGMKGLNKSKKYYDQCLSLPIYYGLTKKDQDKIIRIIKDILI